MKIVSIHQQPAPMRFKNINLLVSHGDYSRKGIYFFYRRIINSNFVLVALNLIDKFIGNRIIISIQEKQRLKNKCQDFDKLQNVIKEKLTNIDVDIFIDGHYHQGSSFTIGNIKYQNLFSFACNQTFFIVKSKDNSIFFKNINLKDF
jgi:UDP-2,3-diacylglucosamine hydrolase